MDSDLIPREEGTFPRGTVTIFARTLATAHDVMVATMVQMAVRLCQASTRAALPWSRSS